MESSSTNRYRHLRNYKCSDTKRSYVHLRTIYQHDAAVLLRLPTRQQLAARRKHITKQRGGGWEIETFHTLQEWSADKMCTTRDEFLGSRSPQNYVEFAALDNAYK
ncbi:hypothetical protein H257_17705 [Aphanomyces astaci]|uniref:Uncharacterized protein n=1 Tax=Aphanomyces astaci TaxID=112090 RepID=W4FDW0_APHAT|nr:hypothetical protein H257_17705 [Aphanomyces astaci]ETV65655.1 hypothetical protein H257_17705 [Aphanomyces astaci]|eukprot:XP_009844894.1 hypothetical protein H257_17705 [Aphanomyces astaci]